jgi:hypothetical protein
MTRILSIAILAAVALTGCASKTDEPSIGGRGYEVREHQFDGARCFVAMAKNGYANIGISCIAVSR